MQSIYDEDRCIAVKTFCLISRESIAMNNLTFLSDVYCFLVIMLPVFFSCFSSRAPRPTLVLPPVLAHLYSKMWEHIRLVAVSRGLL